MKHDKEIKKFISFLSAAGAEILTATNEWELVRFRGKGETGIIYCNKMGKYTFTGVAQEAWDAFEHRKPWEGADKVKRFKKSTTKGHLLTRDGNACFYCGKEMEENDMTIEHLFAVNQGGKNHVNNMVLAHYLCNAKAGHMPVYKKILLREKLHGFR